jgi:hypothetical protein
LGVGGLIQTVLRAVQLMLDADRDHYQFAIDLEKYCPELVEAERGYIDDSCLVVSPILDRA